MYDNDDNYGAMKPLATRDYLAAGPRRGPAPVPHPRRGRTRVSTPTDLAIPRSQFGTLFARRQRRQSAQTWSLRRHGRRWRQFGASHGIKYRDIIGLYVCATVSPGWGTLSRKRALLLEKLMFGFRSIPKALAQLAIVIWCSGVYSFLRGAAKKSTACLRSCFISTYVRFHAFTRRSSFVLVSGLHSHTPSSPGTTLALATPIVDFGGES